MMIMLIMMMTYDHDGILLASGTTVDRNHEAIMYHPPIIIEINMLMIINHHHYHHHYFSIDHIPLIVYTLLIDQKWMELSIYLFYVTIQLSSIQWKSSHRDANKSNKLSTYLLYSVILLKALLKTSSDSCS